MKKTLLLVGLMASALSACSVGTPSMSVGLGTGFHIGNVGLGTSINVPVSLKKDNTPTLENGTNHLGSQIISYFDASGNASNSASNSSFYRQLIQKNGNDYLVQDFYSGNKAKRTDPYTLSRDKLMIARATPENGSLVVYAYNGQVLQQQVFQNGRLMSAKY